VNVIVIDHHLPNDGRIQKHIKYLISNNINVYHLHYNLLFDSLQPGFYDFVGGKNFRINLPKERKGIIFGALRLSKLFRRELTDMTEKVLQEMNIDIEHPTIVHVHDPLLLPIAVNLIKYKFSDFKIVYDRHEVYEKLPGFKNLNLFTFVEFFARKYVSGVVIIDKEHNLYVSRVFSSSCTIAVPNFPYKLDYDVNFITKKIESFKKSSEINLVYLGSLSRRFDRDIDLLLKLVDFLLKNDARIKFTIAGAYGDSELEKILLNYQDIFPNRFSYLGEITQENVVNLTQNAHLGFEFIKPDSSYWVKVSSVKVFEYLTCGVVPVVRANLDIADDLREFSLIFDRNAKEEDIIRSVSDLISNTNKHKEFMKQAFLASSRYSWDSAAIEYIKLYNHLLKKFI
jgi:glycosyltransferase involved in cell wall biosynthesis